MKNTRRIFASTIIAVAMSLVLAVLFLGTASRGFAYDDTYGREYDVMDDCYPYGCNDGSFGVKNDDQDDFYEPGRGIRRDGWGNPIPSQGNAGDPFTFTDSQDERLDQAFDDRYLYNNMLCGHIWGCD